MQLPRSLLHTSCSIKHLRLHYTCHGPYSSALVRLLQGLTIHPCQPSPSTHLTLFPTSLRQYKPLTSLHRVVPDELAPADGQQTLQLLCVAVTEDVLDAEAHSILALKHDCVFEGALPVQGQDVLSHGIGHTQCGLVTSSDQPAAAAKRKQYSIVQYSTGQSGSLQVNHKDLVSI